MDKATQEELLVTALGLPEALKVRTISKGPPYAYTVLRCIQKKMHSTLRKLKTFSFIGKPNDEEGILNALGRELFEDQVYLSGDYKAATNNIRSYISETIADEVCLCWEIEGDLRKLFIDALVNHIFVEKTGERLPQVNGQLMGSIVSFPVLCIANAALSRWAMEVADRRVWSLADAPLTVNGDDVALRARKTVYPIWSKITRQAGLIESVGKTFVSKDWVSINSTMYQRTPQPFIITCTGKDGRVRERESNLQEVPFVNMGLMLGESRNTRTPFSLNDLKGGVTFGSRAKDLISSCPDNLKMTVYKRYLLANAEVLKETRMPWFMPEWIGGLGLPILDPATQKNSKLDYQLASQIILDWGKKHPVSLADQNVPWMVRRIIQKHMPPTTLTDSKDRSHSALAKVESMLAVNCLFDSNVTLSSLFTPQKEVETSKVRIRYNARFWDPSKVRKVPAIVDDEFLYGKERFEGLMVKEARDKNNVQVPRRPESYREYVDRHDRNLQYFVDNQLD
jgi:hypothetical protein